MANSVLSFQNEVFSEFSNSSGTANPKISQLETILECKCAETDKSQEVKAANTAREVEMLKEFDNRLNVELGQLKQRYEMMLSREQARAWCEMKEANRDGRNKMAALRSQLECRHIAGLMFVLCAERNKCHRLRNNILADFNLHVGKLEEILFNRQMIIEEFSKACRKSSEVDQEWRQRMKKLIREFQQFITYTLDTNPEASQYLLDVEKLMDCNSIKYQEIDGEPVYEEGMDIGDLYYVCEHLAYDSGSADVFDYKDHIGNGCFCPNLEEVIEAMGEDIFDKWMDPAENPPPERVEQVLYGELGKWSSERPEMYYVEPINPTMAGSMERTPSKLNGGVLAAKDSTEIISSTKILKKNGSHSKRSSSDMDMTDDVQESNISILLSTANIRLHASSSHNKKPSMRTDRSILKIREDPGTYSAESHIHTLVQEAEMAMKDNDADPDGPRLSKLGLITTDSLEILSHKNTHSNGGKVAEVLPDELDYINKECPAKSCYEKKRSELPKIDVYGQLRRASLPPYLQTEKLLQSEPNEPCTLEQLKDLIKETHKDIEPVPKLSKDSFLEVDGHRNAATSTEEAPRIGAKDYCVCRVPEVVPKKKKFNANGDRELLDVIPQSRLFDKKVEFNRFRFLGNVYTKILTDRKESAASQSPELMEELLQYHPSLCELMCDI